MFLALAYYWYWYDFRSYVFIFLITSILQSYIKCRKKWNVIPTELENHIFAIEGNESWQQLSVLHIHWLIRHHSEWDHRMPMLLMIWCNRKNTTLSAKASFQNETKPEHEQASRSSCQVKKTWEPEKQAQWCLLNKVRWIQNPQDEWSSSPTNTQHEKGALS